MKINIEADVKEIIGLLAELQKQGVTVQTNINEKLPVPPNWNSGIREKFNY